MFKKILVLVLGALLLCAVPVFALDNNIHGNFNSIVSSEGGQGGKGGDGGSVIDSGNSFNINKTGDVNVGNGFGNFSPSAKIEKGAVDVDNVDINLVNVKQGPVSQGQFQGQDNDVSIKIKNERGYANTVGTDAAELNHRDAKMDFYAHIWLPGMGLQGVSMKDTIKEVIAVKANIPFKKLYKTMLKMKAKEGAIRYNMRVWIVKAENTKSWSTNGQLSGSGAYTGNAGANALTGFVPAIGGSKAHDLFTVQFVIVELPPAKK